MMRVEHWYLAAGIGAPTLVALSGTDVAFSLFGIAVAILWLGLFFYLTMTGGPRGVGLFSGSLVVALAIGFIGTPAQARLMLSEGAIESAGREVLNGHGTRAAGWYRVHSTHVSTGGCAILVSRTVFLNDEGFAYCPDGADPQDMPQLLSNVYEYSASN